MTRPLLALALLLTAAPAGAQIATDRPGLGFSPTVVPRGTVQVEAGLPQAARLNVNPFFGGGSLTFYSFPVLLRYGLSDTVELRAGTSVYNAARAESGGGSNTDGDVGFDIVEVGVKLQRGVGDPAFAILPSVLVPTTEAGTLTGAVRAIAGFALTDRLSLGTTLGVLVADAEPDAAVRAELVGALGTALTDAVSGYAELGAYPGEGATPVYAGGGLTGRLSPDVQLDASFDVGLTDSAADLLFGAGVSFRF